MLHQLVTKSLEKPSSLGELLLLRLKTTSRISIGEGTAIGLAFCSTETKGPVTWKRDSEGVVGGDWNRLEKKSTAWSQIWPSSEKVESLTEILLMRLKMPLDLANWWKNRVFLSPSWSHLILDICFQRSNSAFNQLWRQNLALFSSIGEDSEGSTSRACWQSRTAFSASTFVTLTYPNTSLFQTLRLFFRNFSFWAKTNWALPLQLLPLAQLVSTTWRKESWVNHIA